MHSTLEKIDPFGLSPPRAYVVASDASRSGRVRQDADNLPGAGFDAERDELYARMRYVMRGQVEPPKARDETRGEKRKPVLSLLEHAYTSGASVVGSLGMMMRLRGGGGKHRRRRTSSAPKCRKNR